MKSTYTETYRLLLESLIAARKTSGLTQSELAARLNRPQSFISKTENGERRLDVIEFIEFCRQLNMDPRALIDKLV